MKSFDPVWDYDYFRKAVSYVLAAVLSLFAFALPKGDAVILPAGETTTALTQTEVVTGSHARDPQTAAFLKQVQPGFVVPGLAEGLIPQGICYDDTHGVYLISGYYEDDTPSQICVVKKDGVFAGGEDDVGRRGVHELLAAGLRLRLHERLDHGGGGAFTEDGSVAHMVLPSAEAQGGDDASLRVVLRRGALAGRGAGRSARDRAP